MEYINGNVILTPSILKNSQEFIRKKYNILEEKPVDFVFHGGSGSSAEEIKEAISYGVIKMNIDTDLQYAYTEGIRNYILEKKIISVHKLEILMAVISQTRNIMTQENILEKQNLHLNLA